MSGYLYVLWHPTFKMYGDNVYKLGMTINPDQRLQSYSPGFLDSVQYLYLSSEFKSCHEAEKVLFYVLRKERLKKQREFFKVDLEVAKRIIKNLESLTADEVHSLYQRSRSGLLSQATLLRLRADPEEVAAFNQQWTTKYTKGENAHDFLDKFKYSPPTKMT